MARKGAILLLRTRHQPNHLLPHPLTDQIKSFPVAHPVVALPGWRLILNPAEVAGWPGTAFRGEGARRFESRVFTGIGPVPLRPCASARDFFRAFRDRS